MPQRDNTDQIPVEQIGALDQRGQPWALSLDWRRKDKLREVTVEDGRLRVFFEDVPGWQDVDGIFAALWTFTRRAGGDWIGRFVWHVRRDALRFERNALVNGVPVPEFSVGVPLEMIDIEPGEEFGLVLAGETVRSAIRRYVMPDAGTPPPEPPPPDGPDSLIDAVKRERARYGTPLTNPEMGRLLNAVAWRHRAKGWGLAAKSVGAYTTQPRTGIRISRDLLSHEPSGRWYDVLADVEGAATPVWQDKGMADLPFVSPVDPAGGDVVATPWPLMDHGPQLIMAGDVEWIESRPPRAVVEWCTVMLGHGPGVGHGFDGPDIGGFEHPLGPRTRQMLAHPLCRVARIVLANDTMRGGPEQLDGSRMRAYGEHVLRAAAGTDCVLVVDPTFDVHERPAPAAAVDAYVEMMRGIARRLRGEGLDLPPLLFGARAENEQDPAMMTMPYAGDYAAWGTHIEALPLWPDFLDAAVGASGGRPAAHTDRIRSRAPGNVRAKDKNPALQAAMIPAARDRDVLVVWGNLNTGVDDEVGHHQWSWPYPNRDRILAANGGPEEPEPPPPDPPPVEPSFSSLLYPGEVEAGELFSIRWATNNADHVELQSDRHGPIDFGLPPVGRIDQSIDRLTTYRITAVADEVHQAQEVLSIEARPRRVPWWRALLDALAALFGQR
jgi:hypothetical protein